MFFTPALKLKHHYRNRAIVNNSMIFEGLVKTGINIRLVLFYYMCCIFRKDTTRAKMMLNICKNGGGVKHKHAALYDYGRVYNNAKK